MRRPTESRNVSIHQFNSMGASSRVEVGGGRGTAHQRLHKASRQKYSFSSSFSYTTTAAPKTTIDQLGDSSPSNWLAATIPPTESTVPATIDTCPLMLKRGGANDEMRRRRRVGWMGGGQKKRWQRKSKMKGRSIVSIRQPCGAIAWLYVCAAQRMRTEGAGGTLDKTYQALREPHFCNYHY